MAVAAFTATGNKATTVPKLSKDVFDVAVKDHTLLKQAYLTYQANGRKAGAKTLKRGEVQGGGRKPWRQKGTGRARVGSIRSPIWRGGGITFGPTGEQNFNKKLSKTAKKTALKQALSLAKQADKISIIETFDCKDGKVAPTAKLLKKMGANRRTLLVVSEKDVLVDRATRNIPNLKAVQANFLNVYDLINADHVIISKKSVPMIEEWLGAKA